MQQAFDQNSIRLTLMKAVQNGRFTMEALDRPSPGFVANTKVDRRTFPGGYEGVQHRNLLRDVEVSHPEAVAAGPDPKDFAAVLPPANPPTQAPDLPVTLECPTENPF